MALLKNLWATFVLFKTTCSASAPGHKIHASCSLVAWLLKTLRSMLPGVAGWAYFFLLPVADEGQGKEMSFSKRPVSGHMTSVNYSFPSRELKKATHAKIYMNRFGELSVQNFVSCFFGCPCPDRA